MGFVTILICIYHFQEGVKKAKDDLHVQFLNLNWEDSVSFAIPDCDLATAVNFIHKARTEGSSVLVHCAQVMPIS